MIASSLNESSALVGSSRRMISGFLRNILAMARRCFCHPESLTHLSPISVSSHCSISKTKSQWARRRAFNNLSSWFPQEAHLSFLSFRACEESAHSFSPSGRSFVPQDDTLEILEIALIRFSLIVASKTLGSCVRYPM